ncbi:MAG: class IV adenylate cyclase [archaeon]
MHLNIEFKARCSNQESVREILKSRGADYKGLDKQKDVYYDVPHGRLKLRMGNIENALIHYDRDENAGIKESHVTLHELTTGDAASLENILAKSLGIQVVVDKKREIYFIENVKIHLDDVAGLGFFVEVEAIDKTGKIGKEKLQEQCDHYQSLFGIEKKDMVSGSYSDLLLKAEEE